MCFEFRWWIRWYYYHITEKYRFEIEAIGRKTQSVVKGVDGSSIAKNRNLEPNKNRNQKLNKWSAKGKIRLIIQTLALKVDKNQITL